MCEREGEPGYGTVKSDNTTATKDVFFLAKDNAKIVSYEVNELFIHTFVSELLLAFTCAFLLMSNSGLYSEP